MQTSPTTEDRSPEHEAEATDHDTAATRDTDGSAELLKMSAFAKRAGVPIPTIKHYLREGLLPEPVRTSRNMAYYDAALIPRVRAIKRLQHEQFLPLKVIRQVLDRIDEEDLHDDLMMEATIARVLGDQASRATITRRQLIEQEGVRHSDLDLLEKLGIIHPEGEGDQGVYRGDDVALMQVMNQARRAGLNSKMLPVEVLGDYVKALTNLARVELELFRRGVMPAAGDDLPKLTEIATTLSERLVVLLRRKLLLPTLRSLAEQNTPTGPAED